MQAFFEIMLTIGGIIDTYVVLLLKCSSVIFQYIFRKPLLKLYVHRL